MARTKATILSNSGHPLTIKEDKFISEYVKTGNVTQSVIEAGYNVKTPPQYGQKLVNKDYIADEIKYRMSLIQKDTIADAQEIMEYFSSVMRGEVTDQFGLEAPLSERTKAAQELAKRQIDMVNRASKNDTPEIKITLDWARDKDSTPTVKSMLGNESDPTPIIENLLNNKGESDE